MNSLETAKKTLAEGGYTCVVASGGQVIFTSTDRGVKPLVEYYHRFGKAHKEDAALADKVIGRAAALLAILAGITQLYAGVISIPALKELEKAGIPAGCETKAEAIRNRAGTGLCPMEQLSQGVTTPEEMLARVEKFLAEAAAKTQP